jgi:hypothetical protein
MGMRVLLLPLALAGCPGPSQYLIADVTAARRPVVDALVTADCRHGEFDRRNPTARTDETGRARLLFHSSERADRCSVTIAKPGFRTVETDVYSLCTTPACPPLAIDLLPPYAPYDRFEPYGGRDYATPPPRGLP